MGSTVPLVPLRWPLLLLDKLISTAAFSMRLLGLLVLSFVGLAAINLTEAQTSSLPQVPKKVAPAMPAETQITFNSVHVDGPYIALTFDDGPSPKLTPKLLDLLAEHHIKATFFVIGQNVVEHPEIVARAVREGHEIGNHSWSHPNFGHMSDESVRLQLKRTDQAIENATGSRPVLLRPPYGSITPRQKRWIHNEFGYDIVLWDVDPLDWKRPGPTAIFSRIMKATRPGSIVLSHDIHLGTIEAMPAILSQLEARGFKFVTVSELIGLAAAAPPKALPVSTSVSVTAHSVAPAPTSSPLHTGP